MDKKSKVLQVQEVNFPRNYFSPTRIQFSLIPLIQNTKFNLYENIARKSLLFMMKAFYQNCERKFSLVYTYINLGN